MRRRRRRSFGSVVARLLLAVVALLLVAAAVGAGALFFGQDTIRERIAASVKARTGRVLTLGGPLSVWPGGALQLSATDVTLDGIGRIGRATADLPWSGVFGLRPEFARILLERPVLDLRAGVPARADRSPTAGSVTGAPVAGERRTATVARVDIVDGRVLLRDAMVDVPRLTVGPLSETAPATLDGVLRLDAVEARVTGRFGGSEERPWPVSISLENSNGRFGAAGNIAAPEQARGYDLAVTGEAADLATFSALASARLPPLRDVRLSARLSDRGGAGPELSDIAVHAGAADFDVAGSPPLHLDHLDIAAPGMDAPASASLAGSLGGAPVRLAATLGAWRGWLGGDVRAPLRLDATGEAAGASLDLHGTVADPMAGAGLDLAVVSRVPDLAALSALAGTRLPPLTDLAISGRLTSLEAGGAGGCRARDEPHRAARRSGRRRDGGIRCPEPGPGIADGKPAGYRRPADSCCSPAGAGFIDASTPRTCGLATCTGDTGYGGVAGA